MGYDAAGYEGLDAQRREYMYKRLIAARPEWANRVDLMMDISSLELEYYRGINDGTIPDVMVSSDVVYAKTVYVTANGSDSNSGGTWGKAKATIAAAIAAAGPSGTVMVGDGTFPLTGSISMDILNSIIGQGSMRTTLSVNFDGIGIDWKPQTAFSGRAAGTLQGLSIINGVATANACGLRISSLVKPKVKDVRTANFTGTNGIGFWFQNIAIGGNPFWSERFDIHGAVSENNTVGVCFDVADGTNSFMYAEDMSFTVNVNAVPAGQPAQIGFLVRNGAALLGCRIDFMGNVAGINGSNTVIPTFIRVQDNLSNIVNSSLSLRGEMTSGTSGISVSIGNGAKILGNTGVIAFVNTTGFIGQFDNGSIFGHSGTVAGLGLGADLVNVDKRYLLSTIRENGAAGGFIANRAGVSTTSPLFGIVSHPPNVGSVAFSDQDFVVLSYDGTNFYGYLRYRHIAGTGPQVNALAPIATRPNTTGALGTIAFTSGTGRQLGGLGDRHLTIPVTFNPTAGAAATCLVELSGDNTTYTALGTWTRPANSTTGVVELVNIEVPYGWYVRLTVTNATLGTGIQY